MRVRCWWFWVVPEGMSEFNIDGGNSTCTDIFTVDVPRSCEQSLVKPMVCSSLTAQISNMRGSHGITCMDDSVVK